MTKLTHKIKESIIENGLLLIFLLIVILRGGREITGVSLLGILTSFYFLLWISEKREFPVTKLTKSFLCLTIWYFISCFYSLNPIMGIIHFLAIFFYFIIMHLSADISSEELKRKFVNLYITISIILGLVVIVQFFFKFNIFSFPNNNLLAGFLAIGAIFLSGKLFFNEKFLSKKLIFYWLCFLITLTGILLTFSRGGLVALLSGFFVLFLYNYKKLLRATTAIIVISSVLFLAIPQEYTAKLFAHKFLSNDAFGRIIIWKTCLSAFLSKPITGWGAGSLKEIYHRFALPVEWEIGRFSKY
ncbi:MAG: O-antigen ligase family protein, partial [Endomicrobiia bacterium]